MTVERALMASKKGEDPYFSSVSLLLHGDGANGAQNNTFLDSSTNNFTITRYGNTTQGSFSPFPIGGAAYNPAVNGGSVYFDGSGDYLSIPNNAALKLTSGDWTIEFWINCSSAQTSTNNAIYTQDNSGAYTGVIITANSSRNVQLTLSVSGGSWAYLFQTIGTYTDNTWCHVAVVKSGTSVKGYFNGNNTLTISGISSLYSTTDPTTIGTYGSSYFKGYISNLRVVKGTAVYTSNFTPPTTPVTAIVNTSLLCNFTNAGIYDNSAKNNLETVGTAQVSTTVKKYGTGSIYLNGLGELTVPDNTALRMGTGDFTIEFWINFSSLSGYQTAFSKGYNAAGGILMQTGAGTGRFCVFINGVNLGYESGTATTGVWIYYAVVRNGTTVTIYRDGVATLSGTSAADINNTSQLQIGNGGAGYPVTGYIDDLRITKGIARYTANFTPPTQAFPNQ